MNFLIPARLTASNFIWIEEEDYKEQLIRGGFGKHTLSSRDTPLQLGLEEAFYISSGQAEFQIAVMTNEEKVVLCVDDLWNIFTTLQEKFRYRYIAYCYYKQKGWIVRDGLLYGADYLLYCKSPELCHSSYLVDIFVYYENGDIRENIIASSHLNLIASLRVSESVKKEYLMCSIILSSFPQPSCSYGDFKSVHYKILESVIGRWEK